MVGVFIYRAQFYRLFNYVLKPHRSSVAALGICSSIFNLDKNYLYPAQNTKTFIFLCFKIHTRSSGMSSLSQIQLVFAVLLLKGITEIFI